jgi:hypothetical protein
MKLMARAGGSNGTDNPKHIIGSHKMVIEDSQERDNNIESETTLADQQ